MIPQLFAEVSQSECYCRLWGMHLAPALLRTPTHEGLIRCGGDRHGLLHQSVEQLPARPGGPSVEAERELIKIIIQMLRANGSLICAQPPAVEARGHAVDRGIATWAGSPLPRMTLRS